MKKSRDTEGEFKKIVANEKSVYYIYTFCELLK